MMNTRSQPDLTEETLRISRSLRLSLVSSHGVADSTGGNEAKVGLFFVVGKGPEDEKIVDPNFTGLAYLGKPSAFP